MKRNGDHFGVGIKFRGRFGDHFKVGDHFGVGIISGAVQLSLLRTVKEKFRFSETPCNALYIPQRKFER